MKLQLAEQAPSLQEVEAYLKEALPNWKKVSIQNGMFVMADKDGTHGAAVTPKKQFVRVVGTYPTNMKRMGFSLSMFAFGILPPAIYYYAVRNGKMKATEREVAELLAKRYGTPTAEA